MEYIAELKRHLATQQGQRETLTALLKQTREDVKGWLQHLSDACQHEIGHLERPENGDVADGDLNVTHKLYLESVKGLREAQELLQSCLRNITDTEADIADTEADIADAETIEQRIERGTQV